MSIHSVKQYQAEVEKIMHYGGTKKETAIRTAFQNLLNEYAKQKGLLLIPEITIRTAKGKNVTPDGTLKDSLRQDWGYWESKDEADDINEEIRKKFAKDYPKDNILFEDSKIAVLFQSGFEKLRVDMQDEEALHRIINTFINYERPEVQNFRKAIELFKQDVPKVTETLRGIIEAQAKTNKKFTLKRDEFHELCKEAINPLITVDDINEMMIQHILTADIFNTIFDEPHFHRENNIAKELEKVLDTFFTGSIRKLALGTIQHYYQAMNAAAAGIADHHEKQKFLKVVYETFYKSYNPKAADRLGVVYTPNEIVRFMIESTDYLLHKHFNKFLEDKNVEILDPATGTGTYICEIIDYIRPNKLAYKYKNEIHANEVAILPYYIANLNIEFTYKQKMNAYEEFESLCFVDTLDNMGFGFKGKQTSMFGISAENSARIKRQNEKKISVIIGNPPYNAKQENYNFQNSNRGYTEIDERIKKTFIQFGKGQNQIVLYDMYTRFIRWAMDRLNENGVVAFVSNNSFIDSNTFDGFRKVIGDEFNHVYIINLKGNARTSGERRRKEGGNVFLDQIRVGVAIYFFVKKEGEKGCQVYYDEIEDYAKAEEKIAYITENKLKDIQFELIRPDDKNNWINLSENDFDELLPLIDKNAKSGNTEEAIFKTFSAGLKTQRDEWVYDFSKEALELKMQFFIDVYKKTLKDSKFKEKHSIKWDRELDKYNARRIAKKFEANKITRALYRPFIKQHFYFDKHFNGMTYQWFEIYNANHKNKYIAINSPGNNKDFHSLISDTVTDLHLTGDSQCLPMYVYDNEGKPVENITDWALDKFRKHYKTEIVTTKPKKGKPDFEGKVITKQDIFHYVYAVLHNPAYLQLYGQNLKRDFPKIPFYSNFFKWVDWGKALVELHLNFETVPAFKLKEVITKGITNPKLRLKVDKESNLIIIDESITLSGIPPEAWKYKLGNKSALEIILDQFKESKITDPTIAEKFNTYKFADYKEHVIDLLKKVCTVSVETENITNQMRALK